MADLQDVWVQFKGLQPQWCEWRVLYQFASAMGFLVDVDWQGMFQTFYELSGSRSYADITPRF
jgi:hypothetical protein